MEARNYEEEISLKELILILIKNLKIILICTAMALVIALVYLFGIAKPVYESSVSGIISIPQTIESKFGTYTFPSINKMDYINIVTSHEVLSKTKEILGSDSSVEGLRSRISIVSEKDMNGFSISVLSDTPENARILAKTLSKVLIEELEYRYKENAIEAFLRDLDVSSKQLAENIKTNQLVLEGLEDQLTKVDPVITLKKMLTSNPTLAAEIANQRGVDLADLSDEVMYEEYINPNYTELEAVVIETKTALNSTKVLLESKELLINELNKEAEGMQLYKTTGDASKLNNSTLDILRSKILINDTPSFSMNAVSPKKTLTLAIASIFGLMVGVFVAFFKNYWKTA
jgi:capsular polysaccharide biosynthesis protein